MSDYVTIKLSIPSLNNKASKTILNKIKSVAREKEFTDSEIISLFIDEDCRFAQVIFDEIENLSKEYKDLEFRMIINYEHDYSMSKTYSLKNGFTSLIDIESVQWYDGFNFQEMQELKELIYKGSKLLATLDKKDFEKEEIIFHPYPVSITIENEHYKVTIEKNDFNYNITNVLVVKEIKSKEYLKVEHSLPF